jgi:phosphohistidine phosphatase
MRIYLLRHGIAETRGPRGGDEQRRLTAEGKRKLRGVLQRARGASLSVSLILSSPCVRAMETAQIAAEILGYTGSIVPSDALAPASSPSAVWQELLQHADEAAVLLAGHEPLFSETASFLLGSPHCLLEMKKGALASIDVERMAGSPRGVLRWLLTPKLAGFGE